MTTLDLMYVYFDKAGNIKTISNELQTLPDDQYSVTMFPLSEVESFLLGKKNPYDFYIKVTKRATGTEYKIVRKEPITANYVRTLDAFLTEIRKMPRSRDANLLITNFTTEKKIVLDLSSVLAVLLEEGTDDEQDAITSFINTPQSSIFFTVKGDPFFLLHIVTFVPRELFSEGTLHFEYDKDLSETSLFTKKIVDKYSYVIK
ncbi:MAG TPA: hypothetical protein VIY47_02950 [Ignavibacteriaceae bacterium]